MRLIKETKRDSCKYLFYVNDQIVGSCCFQEEGYIHSFEIVQEYVNRGYGTMMLKELLKDKTSVYLDVSPYKKYGIRSLKKLTMWYVKVFKTLGFKVSLTFYKNKHCGKYYRLIGEKNGIK